MKILLPIVCFTIMMQCCGCAFDKFIPDLGWFSDKKPEVEMDEEYAYIDFADFDHEVENIEKGIIITCKAPNPLLYVELKKLAEDFKEKACKICRDIKISNKYKNPNVEITITSENSKTVKFLQKIAIERKRDREKEENADEPMIERTKIDNTNSIPC